MNGNFVSNAWGKIEPVMYKNRCSVFPQQRKPVISNLVIICLYHPSIPGLSQSSPSEQGLGYRPSTAVLRTASRELTQEQTGGRPRCRAHLVY